MDVMVKVNRQAAFNGFKHFWGKQVLSFNPEKHCRQCLLGHDIKCVKPHMLVDTSFPVPSKEGNVFYFCGVALPECWEANFHLAVVHDTSARVEKRLHHGYTFIVEGARELTFDSTTADALDLPEKFKTCRNFQFGAQYFGSAPRRTTR